MGPKVKKKSTKDDDVEEEPKEPAAASKKWAAKYETMKPHYDIMNPDVIRLDTSFVLAPPTPRHTDPESRERDRDSHDEEKEREREKDEEAAAAAEEANKWDYLAQEADGWESESESISDANVPAAAPAVTKTPRMRDAEAAASTVKRSTQNLRLKKQTTKPQHNKEKEKEKESKSPRAASAAAAVAPNGVATASAAPPASEGGTLKRYELRIGKEPLTMSWNKLQRDQTRDFENRANNNVEQLLQRHEAENALLLKNLLVWMDKPKFPIETLLATREDQDLLEVLQKRYLAEDWETSYQAEVARQTLQPQPQPPVPQEVELQRHPQAEGEKMRENQLERKSGTGFIKSIEPLLPPLPSERKNQKRIGDFSMVDIEEVREPPVAAAARRPQISSAGTVPHRPHQNPAAHRSRALPRSPPSSRASSPSAPASEASSVLNVHHEREPEPAPAKTRLREGKLFRLPVVPWNKMTRTLKKLQSRSVPADDQQSIPDEEATSVADSQPRSQAESGVTEDTNGTTPEEKGADEGDAEAEASVISGGDDEAAAAAAAEDEEDEEEAAAAAAAEPPGWYEEVAGPEDEETSVNLEAMDGFPRSTRIVEPPQPILRSARPWSRAIDSPAPGLAGAAAPAAAKNWKRADDTWPIVKLRTSKELPKQNSNQFRSHESVEGLAKPKAFSSVDPIESNLQNNSWLQEKFALQDQQMRDLISWIKNIVAKDIHEKQSGQQREQPQQKEEEVVQRPFRKEKEKEKGNVANASNAIAPWMQVLHEHNRMLEEQTPEPSVYVAKLHAKELRQKAIAMRNKSVIDEKKGLANLSDEEIHSLPHAELVDLMKREQIREIAHINKSTREIMDRQDEKLQEQKDQDARRLSFGAKIFQELYNIVKPKVGGYGPSDLQKIAERATRSKEFHDFEREKFAATGGRRTSPGAALMENILMAVAEESWTKPALEISAAAANVGARKLNSMMQGFSSQQQQYSSTSVPHTNGGSNSSTSVPHSKGSAGTLHTIPENGPGSGGAPTTTSPAPGRVKIQAKRIARFLPSAAAPTEASGDPREKKSRENIDTTNASESGLATSASSPPPPAKEEKGAATEEAQGASLEELQALVASQPPLAPPPPITEEEHQADTSLKTMMTMIQSVKGMALGKATAEEKENKETRQKNLKASRDKEEAAIVEQLSKQFLSTDSIAASSALS